MEFNDLAAFVSVARAGGFRDAARISGVSASSLSILLEHLGQDTQHLDSSSAMQLYQRIARENAARWEAGDFDWQGLACSLNPATYGEVR